MTAGACTCLLVSEVGVTTALMIPSVLTCLLQVFVGSWLLYSLLVRTYYKTSLTSSLAVPFKPPTINTPQQLLSSNIKVAMNHAKVHAELLMQKINEYIKHSMYYIYI